MESRYPQGSPRHFMGCLMEEPRRPTPSVVQGHPPSASDTLVGTTITKRQREIGSAVPNKRQHLGLNDPPVELAAVQSGGMDHEGDYKRWSVACSHMGPAHLRRGGTVESAGNFVPVTASRQGEASTTFALPSIELPPVNLVSPAPSSGSTIEDPEDVREAAIEKALNAERPATPGPATTLLTIDDVLEDRRQMLQTLLKERSERDQLSREHEELRRERDQLLQSYDEIFELCDRLRRKVKRCVRKGS